MPFPGFLVRIPRFSISEIRKTAGLSVILYILKGLENYRPIHSVGLKGSLKYKQYKIISENNLEFKLCTALF